MVGAQTILVHGATDGIGREVALRMARRGDTVFATGTNVRALADLRRQANGMKNLQTVRINPSSADSVARLKQRVNRHSQNLGVDVLVNNAGADLGNELPEPVGLRELCTQLERGLLGMVALIGAFVPQMRVRGSGRIINISPTTTTPGLLPSAGRLCCGAAKALSMTLRKELAPFGIDVVFVENATQSPAPAGAPAEDEDDADRPSPTATLQLVRATDPGPVIRAVELAIRARQTTGFLAQRGDQALAALTRVIGERRIEQISRAFVAATSKAGVELFARRK